MLQTEDLSFLRFHVSLPPSRGVRYIPFTIYLQGRARAQAWASAEASFMERAVVAEDAAQRAEVARRAADEHAVEVEVSLWQALRSRNISRGGRPSQDRNAPPPRIVSSCRSLIVIENEPTTVANTNSNAARY